MKIDISFIILSWNSQQYLKACVDSIFSDCNAAKFAIEIFIIDNGSHDQSKIIIKQLVAEYPDQVVPIFLKKNYGTTYPRNLGLKQSKGKNICIIDSDIKVLEGCFRELVDILSRNPDIGIVAPKLIYPNGKLQKSTDDFPTIFRKIYRYFYLRKIEDKENENSKELHHEVFNIDYAISALWLMNRSILEDVGYLDERIFYSPEDVDYCLRTWTAGYRIIYTQNAKAIHRTQEISRNFKFNKAFLHHIAGLLYYFIKHRYLFHQPNFKKVI